MRSAGIIPVFNQVRWVETAVLSMLPEVDELVVVDDASTDGTAHVLQSLQDSYGFTLILKDNTEGVSAACNSAIEVSSADIILLQGGDDRTLCGRGDRSRTALADPEVSLVYSLPAVIDADDQLLPLYVAQEFAAGSLVMEPLRYLFDVGNYLCAPSTAFRRQDYIQAGGFPPGIDLLQDYALWLQLALVGRFQRVSDPLVEYRKHATNLSREYMGVDTPRRRRHAAELAWVRNRFLDAADKSEIERVSAFASSLSSEALNRDDLAILARLGHTNRPLVREGLDRLFTQVAIHGVSELSRLGLRGDDLNYFSSLADHENFEELGRSAATIAALTRPMPE